MVMDSLAEIMVRFSANYGKNDQMYLYIDTLAGNVLNIAQNYSKNKVNISMKSIILWHSFISLIFKGSESIG